MTSLVPFLGLADAAASARWYARRDFEIELHLSDPDGNRLRIGARAS